MDRSDNTAQRQYAIGVINRRIAISVAEMDRGFQKLTGEPGKATFLCACGRKGGCRALVTIPLPDYERVRASPHRFLIAPGHAQRIDEVVHEGSGYEVVQIRPEYRDAMPPTADL